MTKKSLNRRMKDMKTAGVAPAPRQTYVPPVATIHPIFGKKLAEIKAEQPKHEEMHVWDDLNTLHVTCAKALMAPAVLGQLAKRKDIIAYIRDQVGLRQRIEMFKRDILQLQEELKAIAAQHSGREGSSTDPDEIMQSITIAEQYNLFKERITAVIDPTVAHIFEIFTEAEMLMLDAQGKLSENGLKPEQDPNVVTDVVASEVASTAANAVAEINS